MPRCARHFPASGKQSFKYFGFDEYKQEPRPHPPLSLSSLQEKIEPGIFAIRFLFFYFRVSEFFFYQEEEEEGSEPRWNISVRVEEIFGKVWLFDSAITGRRGMEFGLLIREIFGKRVGNGVRTVFKENKFFGTRAAEYLWWMRRVKGYGVPFDDAILEHPCESTITTPKKFLSTLFNVDIIVPSIPYKILFLRHCCLV